ncbi:GNAT family N-acetyltransferase [Anaerocolumna sp. MB42-C2]|uniref:GNAT family N-acetyltransferase n=1 Tax=Anaerocolumna sp. MB42-C2 TaxID=3070997 RepID=UPI0027DEB448|nr:GNAT family N-acetyltransferase [Anaerocolumna sp. MB42-C2]WMJ90137.1 GNAT family N-acetyltransferase [Anaerocolumna sp. MB42-C2]
MFRNMDKGDINFANEMLHKINTCAVEVFNESYRNGNIYQSYVFESITNRGIFIIIRAVDYFSIQLSFEKDICNYKIIQFIDEKYHSIIKERQDRDIYVNINAANAILNNYFSDLSLERDSYGFEFYISSDFDTVKELENYSMRKDMQIKEFEDKYALDYLHLLDDAFRAQQMECNEEQDGYCKNSEEKSKWLKNLSVNHGFHSFWVANQLVGVGIVDDNYIDTIAIHPQYERKGYGSEILKYYINNLLCSHKFSELYLVTYYQNRKAQRLYLKNGFKVRGFYSENTFNGCDV